jgi:hypothetical protein
MSTKEDLLNVFEQLKQALMGCDPAALENIYAADYKGFNVRGEAEGRELVFAFYKPGGVQLIRYDIKDIEVNVIGDAGIISGEGFVEG